MSFSAQKMHFFEKNGFFTHWPAQASNTLKEIQETIEGLNNMV